MKRISILLISLMIGMCHSFQVFAYDFTVDGLYYQIISEDDLTVQVTYKESTYEPWNETGTVINDATGNITIPSSVINEDTQYSVISIGQFAFYGCGGLTGISIPNSVIEIGDKAFAWCKNLSTITVDTNNSVYDSRNNCNAIIETNTNTLLIGCKKTIIPNSVTSIGDYAFFLDIKSFTIPETITYVSDKAFNGCSDLKVIVNLSSLSLTNLGTNLVIYNCYSENDYAIMIKDGKRYLCGYTGHATSLNIPDVDYIAKYAFYYYPNELYSVIMPNSVIGIGAFAFSGCNIKMIYLGDNLQTIDSFAFEYCSGLYDISIPDNVIAINGYAFQYCSDLESIYIGSNVESIDCTAFLGCAKLEEISVSPYNKKYDNRYSCNAVIESQINTLILGCKGTLIPNSVTRIGYLAFIGSGLTSITIPDNVLTIDLGAFANCKELEEISLSNNLNAIARSAFYGCTKLKKISIPNNVCYIGLSSFEENALTEYENAYYLGNKENPYRILYSAKSNISYIHDDCEYVANEDLTFDSSEQLNEFDNAYYLGSHSNPYLCLVKAKNKNIVSCNVHEDCLCIGKSAFHGCSKLKNVTIGEKVLAINNSAFYDCKNLKSLTFPNQLKSLGDNSLRGCSRLTEVRFPKSVKFLSNTPLPNFTQYSLFTGCTNLTTINVEQGNCVYDSRENCNAIIETASNKLYFGCKATKIPETITCINDFAYCNHQNLEKVVIPKKVSSIGIYSFNGCNNLAKVIVKNTSPIYIESTTFSNRKNATLYVPEGSKSAYEAAEYWNEFKNIVEVSDLDLIDGETYSQSYDTYTNVCYTRTFTNNQWQALYVPFSIPVETLADNGVQVAELNDTHQWDWDGDGTADSTRLEFFTLKAGYTEPNYPYLIKANEEKKLELNLEDVEVKASEELSYECSSLKQRFTFVGTYSGVAGAEMYDNNYYAMAGGCLQRASDNTVSLKPQRWYLKIENKNGEPVSYYAPTIRFIIDGIEEEETTGIASIPATAPSQDALYSLDGLRLNGTPTKPGLYVNNGKKLVIR